jgi:hypothetical protein
VTEVIAHLLPEALDIFSAVVFTLGASSFLQAEKEVSRANAIINNRKFFIVVNKE